MTEAFTRKVEASFSMVALEVGKGLHRTHSATGQTFRAHWGKGE
jgi:hypothetical protein